MNMTRSLVLTRLCSCALKNQIFQNVKIDVKKQIIRNHGKFYYRKMGTPDPVSVRRGTILGAIFWWWITWHILTDYNDVIGAPNMPDPSTWTDEELGIPSDYED